MSSVGFKGVDLRDLNRVNRIILPNSELNVKDEIKKIKKDIHVINEQIKILTDFIITRLDKDVEEKDENKDDEKDVENKDVENRYIFSKKYIFSGVSLISGYFLYKYFRSFQRY